MTQPAFSKASPPNQPLPEGLILRRPVINDAPGIVELLSLPGYRFGTLRVPYPKLQDVEAFFQNLPDESISLIGEIDGQIVASAGISRLKGRRIHVATLGIGVHDDFVGRGIGGALMRELTDIADNWMNLHRIELTVFDDNPSAIRLYERYGFEIEGTLRDFGFRDGAYVDAYMMARLKN